MHFCSMKSSVALIERCMFPHSRRPQVTPKSLGVWTQVSKMFLRGMAKNETRLPTPRKTKMPRPRPLTQQLKDQVQVLFRVVHRNQKSRVLQGQWADVVRWWPNCWGLHLRGCLMENVWRRMRLAHISLKSLPLITPPQRSDISRCSSMMAELLRATSQGVPYGKCVERDTSGPHLPKVPPFNPPQRSDRNGKYVEKDTYVWPTFPPTHSFTK